MTQKEAIAKAPVSRVRRTPLGARNVLTLSGKEPGYEYRFVNDAGDRVNEFKDRGWELVKQEDVRVGDARLGTPTNKDSVAKAHVGNGMFAYAMRIQKDWYDEDQAAKQEYVNQTEEATRQEALNGTYGKLEIGRSK